MSQSQICALKRHFTSGYVRASPAANLLPVCRHACSNIDNTQLTGTLPAAWTALSNLEQMWDTLPGAGDYACLHACCAQRSHYLH